MVNRVRDVGVARNGDVSDIRVDRPPIQQNADVFQGVAHAADQEVTAQRLGQTYAATGFNFSIEAFQARNARS